MQHRTHSIGIRDSALAIAQTRAALATLAPRLPELELETTLFSSPGDRDRQTDLQTAPPDFFTRDLDEAVRTGLVDLALHSAKDCAYPAPEGLDWVWLPWREDPTDALVLRPGCDVADLPASPVIGVSSDRRVAYSQQRFPHASLQPIRGNIDMRLQQLDQGDYDAVIIATAALNRLGLSERITERIPLTELPVPAAQGFLNLTFSEGEPRWQRLRALFVKPVTFVSSGIGGPDTCTMAGIEALSLCDICLYDALLDPALLEQLPTGAERIPVGKRCGAHSVPQEAITMRIAEEARKGKRVVRLKGGDAGIFGRLAEEVAELERLALPYRIIPGVSAFQTVAATTGMQLTRRGETSGFCVMTAREKEGAADVTGPQRERLPIVLYMGTRLLPQIVAQLRDRDGLAPDTPVAITYAAGAPTQAVVRGTLATIEVKHAGFDADGRPGLIFVGAPAAHPPIPRTGALAGMRVVVTGSAPIQQQSRRAILDYGGVPIALPLIAQHALDTAQPTLADMRQYDWLVITSPGAVRCLLELMQRAKQDLRQLPRLLVCGTGTARELSQAGLQADAMPAARYSAASVVTLAGQCATPGARLLRVRSDIAGTELATSLQQQGFDVTDCILYETVPAPRPDNFPASDAIFFASSSAVRVCVEQWGRDILQGRICLAIGEPTAVALREAGMDEGLGLRVAPEATCDSAIGLLAADAVGERL